LSSLHPLNEWRLQLSRGGSTTPVRHIPHGLGQAAGGRVPTRKVKLASPRLQLDEDQAWIEPNSESLSLRFGHRKV
jgi:hypothetical protein